jgi:outer membrane protein OmpA-like peptidoglycan-associated protein
VVAYLGTKGIAAARMVTRAGGEGAPLAPDNTPEGRDQNRRLEMTITPLPS